MVTVKDLKKIIETLPDDTPIARDSREFGYLVSDKIEILELDPLTVNGKDVFCFCQENNVPWMFTHLRKLYKPVKVLVV
jgi:hypothetical protein